MSLNAPNGKVIKRCGLHSQYRTGELNAKNALDDVGPTLRQSKTSSWLDTKDGV